MIQPLPIACPPGSADRTDKRHRRRSAEGCMPRAGVDKRGKTLSTRIPESPNPRIPESPNPRIPESPPNPRIPESPNPRIPESPNPRIPGDRYIGDSPSRG